MALAEGLRDNLTGFTAHFVSWVAKQLETGDLKEDIANRFSKSKKGYTGKLTSKLGKQSNTDRVVKNWAVLVTVYQLLSKFITEMDEDYLLPAWEDVIAGSNSNWYLRYHRRYKTYTDVEFDRGYEVEEFGLSGMYCKSDWWSVAERWSRFASKVDFHLDITATMKTIAEEYDDDLKGLIALYILTTGVEPMETIATFGHPKSMVYERIKGVRDRLQRILKDYEPIQPCNWQERLQAGEVEPYLKVVEHYQDKPLALMALYTLTTQTKINRYAKDEKQRKMITYYRKKCLKRIEVAYGQAASF